MKAYAVGDFVKYIYSGTEIFPGRILEKLPNGKYKVRVSTIKGTSDGMMDVDASLDELK